MMYSYTMRRPGNEKSWKSSEIKYLLDNYKTKSIKEMAEHLKYSEQRVKTKCLRHGFTKRNFS